MTEPKPLTKEEMGAGLEELHSLRRRLRWEEFRFIGAHAIIESLKWAIATIGTLRTTVADLELQLAAARERIGWWEELWEIARNGDPQLDFLYEKFASEKD